MTDRVVAYAAFDPGQTTGYAFFNKEGEVLIYGQIATLGELLTKLEEIAHVKNFIVEDYKIFGHMAKVQTGSRGPAQQAIGAIQAFAQKHHIKVWLQPASILPIATKLTQVRMPSNHSSSHQVSAYLHGSYWLIRKGIKKTALELEHEATKQSQT